MIIFLQIGLLLSITDCTRTAVYFQPKTVCPYQSRSVIKLLIILGNNNEINSLFPEIIFQLHFQLWFLIHLYNLYNTLCNKHKTYHHLVMLGMIFFFLYRYYYYIGINNIEVKVRWRAVCTYTVFFRVFREDFWEWVVIHNCLREYFDDYLRSCGDEHTISLRVSPLFPSIVNRCLAFGL